MQMLDEAVRAAEVAGDGSEGQELPEPVRLDVSVDAYVPADYVPYEQAKIEVHRRLAGGLDVDLAQVPLERLRKESEHVAAHVHSSRNPSTTRRTPSWSVTTSSGAWISKSA